MRILVVLPVLAMLCAPAAHPVAQPVTEVRPATTRGELVTALEVLHEWDARRARAWARADLDALRALYVRGSGAGRADVRLLHAYQRRGVVVRRMVTQVFAVRVLRSSGSALQMRVFDRVAGGRVLDHGGDVEPLRSSPPKARTITFHREAGTWRVAEVSDSGRAPRAARP